MFYICTIVMPFTVLQCVNKDIIYNLAKCVIILTSELKLNDETLRIL